MFYREKKVDCGTYREVDIIPRTDDAERAAKGTRKKRSKASTPAQKNLNEKNAKRYLVQVGNGNFGPGDLHISATYSPENLPDTLEEAEKNVTNFLHRVAYRREKLGLPPLKYILVTEYAYPADDTEGKPVRIHHHIIMNGGLDRDAVELMWTKKRINWKRFEADKAYGDTVERLGWVNADRIQTNENGVEALCRYIMKNPKGKSGGPRPGIWSDRWSSRPQTTSTAARRWSALQSRATTGESIFRRSFRPMRSPK